MPPSARYPWFVSAVVVALVGSAAAPSDAAFTRNGDATVSFAATGPAGMAINGTTSELSVVEAAGDVAVTVPLAHLTTGISLRDEHMRTKYLEVPTYPQAVLHVARAALALPKEAPAASSFVGALTLHGVTRNVTVSCTARRLTDGLYAVAATTALDMRDFNIAVPSYLGVAVKPNVTLDVRFVAKD